MLNFFEKCHMNKIFSDYNLIKLKSKNSEFELFREIEIKLFNLLEKYDQLQFLDLNFSEIGISS